MRKFRFNLQRLLDYRESIEEKLLAELAVLRAHYEREVRSLEAARSLCDTYRENMRAQLTCGTVEDITVAHRYLNELHRQVIFQEQRVKQAEAMKDSKMVEVIEASKDRKVLERLREYKLMEHKRETEVQEQKFLDDIATIRHNRSAASEASQEA